MTREDYPADVGCTLATAFRREQTRDPETQSLCLECPFDRCVEERDNEYRRKATEARLNQVKTMLEEGSRTGEIAAELGVRPRMVRYYRMILRNEITR
jgi:DNA-binding NarL/FixJ family response regulator